MRSLTHGRWVLGGLVMVCLTLACREGLGSQPAEPLAEARALLQRGDLAGAKANLSGYLQAHPEAADAHFLLGYVLFREKMPKESLAEFTAGAKTQQVSAADLKIVAADYVVLGDFADADKWLTLALQRAPEDAEGWYLLGRTKYNENRFAEAIASFEHTLALRPKDVKAEDNIGLSYEGLNDVGKARAAYLTAIAWQEGAAEKNAQPMMNLGGMLLRGNQAAEAVPYLERAVGIDPRNAKAHEELGDGYLALNQLEKAEREFEAAAGLAPEASALHYKLGKLYRRQGKTSEANREFAICSKLLSTHSSTDTPNLPSER